MTGRNLVRLLFVFPVYVFAQQCSLLESCNSRSLPVHSIRALSSEIVQISCPVIMGVTGIDWYKRAIPDMNTSELITVDGSQFSSSGVRLSITYVTHNLEGEYSCIRLGIEEKEQFHALECLVVKGIGYFASCPNMTSLTGCSDVVNIDVVNEVVERLDVRVTFRDGGLCTNQSIRQLTVQKNSTTVYSCVNIVSFQMSPCASNDKFEVITECPDCAPDDLQCCKYSIFLNFKSFSEADVGTYIATVTLEESRNQRRRMTKEFDVDIVPKIETTPADIEETTPAEIEETSSAQEVNIGAKERTISAGRLMGGRADVKGIMAGLVLFILHVIMLTLTDTLD